MSTRTTDYALQPDGSRIGFPGGPAWYMAEALRRLGRPYTIITGEPVNVEVIDTPNGEEYVIPAIPPIPLPDRLSGSAVVLSPIMQELPPDRIPPVDGILVVDLQGFVRTPGEPSGQPGRRFELSNLLQRADFVKASQAELLLLSDESVRSLGATTLVETRGRRGALVHEAGKIHAVEAHDVAAPDTIGAGDTFLAALVHALVSGNTVLAAATAAARFTETILRERVHGPVYRV